MKVLVALSGGVDSSVVAARMVAAGHDVTAAHMSLMKDSVSLARAELKRGCGSPRDAEDAAALCERLGIPFEVWNLAEVFEQRVVEDFIAQYGAGLTPNPCVRCNQLLKFHELVNRALEAGFDAVATGHYARSSGGVLRRAAFRAKDQSYVLASTGPGIVSRAFFPLGDVASKDAVREEARGLGLSVADKAESFDVCFIPDGDTKGFLARRLGERPGEVVDERGVVVGEHGGVFGFTIGQRKGLGTVGPAADGEPRYVREIDAKSNTVFIAPRPALAVRKIFTSTPVWWGEGDTVVPETVLEDVEVQFRAHGKPIEATVTISPQGMEAVLKDPALGIAPGQSLVVYKADQVLSQATITGTN
ncbi:MAG: tRNA 2-thiouridine(34) synthase MnmA [Actinomycetaceae bacterium]|nr:tRNA 2-thiouridine(34) synthase MnmA [Actinomycetaceae bacterium]